MLLRRGARVEKIPQVRTVGTSPSEPEAGDAWWEPAHPFLKQVRKVGTSPSALVCLDALRGAFKAFARPGRTWAPDTGLRFRPAGFSPS